MIATGLISLQIKQSLKKNKKGTYENANIQSKILWKANSLGKASMTAARSFLFPIYRIIRERLMSGNNLEKCMLCNT